MKQITPGTNTFSQTVCSTLWNRKTELSLVSVAVLLSACGGGGGSSDGTVPPPVTVTPILQVGMQRQFEGATIRTVVYANPSGNDQNNTLAYSYTENQTVLAAPANAPGYFDINSVYAYTITQDPGLGSVPLAQTVDDYRNLVVSGSNQYTIDLGQNATTIANDETANTLGGGPYTQTTVTAQTYPTARYSLTYPLITGAVNTIPQSLLQTINFTDLNASSVAPPTNFNYGYTRNRTQNNDGSFSYQQTGVTGINQTYTANSDGSGTSVIANGITATTTTNTVGLPIQSNGFYTIPVNVLISGATSSNIDYLAFDWYPANVPSSPLVLSTQTVAGPVSTLPSACNGALFQPDMVEVDTTTTNLNTLGANYSVTTTQTINSNGVAVCTLTNETSTSYSLKTGAVYSTTTTQTTAILTAIN